MDTLEVEERGFGLSRVGETLPGPLIHRKDDNVSGRTICGQRTVDTRRERRDLALDKGERCSTCFPSHGDEVAADGGNVDRNGGVGTPVAEGVGGARPLIAIDARPIPLVAADTLEISRTQAVGAAAALLVVGGLVGLAGG